MVHKNWLIVVSCALGGHAVNLIPFSYGMFLPYVYSYLRENDPTLQASLMHIHAPLCLTVATGTAWTFGVFQKYVRQLYLHVFNGLCMAGWMVLLYLFGHNFFFITVAIAAVGFHAGQLHVFFSQRVTEEGRKYASTANGVYGFLFGLAGLWGNIMSSLFINPWGVEPTKQRIPNSTDTTYSFDDDRVLKRVQENWLILAGVMFCLLFPGYFCIAKNQTDEDADAEEKVHILASTAQDGDQQGEGEEEGKEQGTAPVVEERIFSPIGFTLFLTTIGIGVSSMCAFDLFKDFGLKKIRDDTFLNITGALIPVVGAVGRIVWGGLGDVLSLRNLFLVGNVLSFALQAMMHPSRLNKYWYVFNTAILSIMPGMMTLLPPSVKRFMGTQNIALKYGIILTGEVFGCLYYLLMTSWIQSYISDLTLVLVLGIPAALATIPTMLFIKDTTSCIATCRGGHVIQ